MSPCARPLFFLLLALNAQSSFPPPPLVSSKAPASAGGGSACDSINDSSLKAYWRLDEASGTRNDTKGANHLTDNNTVTSGTGKISNAADCEIDNNEYLSISDNADLSLGADTDFTIFCWVKPESFAGYGGIVSKGNPSAVATFEYTVDLDPSGYFRFYVGNGSSFGIVDTSSLGAVSAGTWYSIAAWHSSADDKVYISRDNGTPISATWAGGTRDGGDVFCIGSEGGIASFFDGLIDEVLFTKRLLTTDERTALYNSGSACRPSGL